MEVGFTEKPWSTPKAAGVYILGPGLSRELAGQPQAYLIKAQTTLRKREGNRWKEEREHNQLDDKAFPTVATEPSNSNFQPSWPWYNYLAGKIDWQGYFLLSS